MRAWAQVDKPIRKVVSQVDDERLTYMSGLFRQMGVKNANFAAGTLGALVGMRQLPGVKTPADAYDSLVDMVLALQ